ncbi:MAG: Gfo/Idh/MocA family oxidoreductase [Sphaerochaetaceae bacterium]|nr:Gfo/Idh/MocA family oxidoreductase [Sphaerochaetaceae bacterium]
MMKDQDALIGVGIRGTGQVAIQHVKAIQNNGHTCVRAVCGRDEQRTKAFIAAYAPEAVWYTDYEKMLADEQVGMVSECMPNYLHAKEAIMALQADKHVILEKPAGINRQESEELAEAARKSKRKSVVSFVLRWHPMIENIKTMLDKKSIGDVYYAEADYWHGISPTFSSYQWIRKQQFAGGAMITGGSHAVDILRYLHGEVAEVSAFSVKKRTDFDYPTTYIASLSFCDGSVGKVSASLDGLSFPYQFNLDLLGAKGAIRDNRFYAGELFSHQSDWMSMTCETPNSGKVSHHPFQNEIDNMVDAILNDTTSRCTIEDACSTMSVAYAITESALKNGAIVKV